MLIEFVRALQQDPDTLGEDDGIAREHKIAVNPAMVAAVFESTSNPNVIILKFSDGRGMQVRGTYAEVMERLEGHMSTQMTGEQDRPH